jgi:hypothetical protein
MITFVSAFLKLEDNIIDRYKSLEDCFQLFEKLLKVKLIKIHLFLSHFYKSYGDSLQSKYNDNLIITYLDLEDLWTYNEVLKAGEVSLPHKRNIPKDTMKYISLQNCKLELINRSIENNYFNTQHFSWIDSRIFHIIKEDVENTFVNDLENMITKDLKKNLLVIPGCWADIYLGVGKDNSHLLYPWLSNIAISWRFCGGFFIGDKNSLIQFFHKFKSVWSFFLSKKIITWEVNIWHFMELQNIITPLWFKADHNNTIINIPNECYL